MTRVYCVLKADVGTGATKDQWRTLFQYARLEDFPQFLTWAAGGTLASQIFSSSKFSRGAGSDPASGRHLYYGFGFEIDAKTLATEVGGATQSGITDLFITAINYAYRRGVSAFNPAVAAMISAVGDIPNPADPNNPVTEGNVKAFVEALDVRVQDASLLIAEAYQERYLVQLQDINWTRAAATNVTELVAAVLEFSLRQAAQAGVDSGEFPAQVNVNDLSVDQLWIGDDALESIVAYLAADFALGIGVSLWYDWFQ